MRELPKIISVDDHVVEPPHVWQTWLPEKYRENGPRVERKKWGAFRLKKGAKYAMEEDPDGEWGDAWIYEDQVELRGPGAGGANLEQWDGRTPDELIARFLGHVEAALGPLGRTMEAGAAQQ